eukprot:6323575-Ditylum_brightwellii.AAC.1
MLTHIEDKANNETITKLKEETYANTTIVPTTLGRGQYSHVGLVSPPTVYSTILSKKYTNPKEPPQPTFAANTIDVVKVKKVGEFKEAQRIYNNHHTVGRVLKQQIKAAVDRETFIVKYLRLKLDLSRKPTYSLWARVM